MGWCLDGNHQDCRTEYVTWGGLGDYRRCGCKCHPDVDDTHIVEYLAANKTGEMVAGRTARSSKTAVAVKTRKPRATVTAATARVRNAKAEAEALAATDAALAAIETDEAVVETMAELLED